MATAFLFATAFGCAAAERSVPTLRPDAADAAEADTTTTVDAAAATDVVAVDVPTEAASGDVGTADATRADGTTEPGSPDAADARAPDLAARPPSDPGTSPAGILRAEPVPGSPSLSAAQLAWWGDRLVIADHGDGGRLVQHVPGGPFTTLVRLPSPFGVAAAPDGTLVVASKTPGVAASSRLVRVQRDGTMSTILEGAAASTPQHVVVHRTGRIYWTNFDRSDVLALAPGATAPEPLKPGVGHSYGIALSPAHDTLYVSSKLPGDDKGWIHAYPLAADGTPTAPGARLLTTLQLTAPTGEPLSPMVGRLQGMAADARGNLYVGGAEGRTTGKEAVAVLDPAAKKAIAVVLAQHNVVDCAFGDADLRTLYVTGSGPGTLFRVRLPVTGLPQ